MPDRPRRLVPREADGRAAHRAPARAYSARILVGPVAETIVKHAAAARCDLICMGTRGHTGAKSALLGSTATRVVHLSDLPVTLVK